MNPKLCTILSFSGGTFLPPLKISISTNSILPPSSAGIGSKLIIPKLKLSIEISSAYTLILLFSVKYYIKPPKFHWEFNTGNCLTDISHLGELDMAYFSKNGP